MTALALAALLAAAALAPHQDGPPPTPADPDAELRTQPLELGTVAWRRDLDAARAESARTGRPILVLVQQVPGGEASRRLGATAFSHPLLADLLEERFVPLLVVDNQPGPDEELLRLLGEAPWSEPVLRLLDAEGADLVPRADQIRTTNMLCEWLLFTHDARGLEPPRTLELLRDETYLQDHPQRFSLATLSMHCYWVGEQRLGALEGVLRTRAGWVGEREVVEVEFDHQVLPYERLLAAAAELECLDRVFAHDRDQARLARRAFGDRVEDLDRAARPVEPDQQWYHLRRTPLGHLPLSSVQCTKLNAALAWEDGRARFEPGLDVLLTARQRRTLERVEAVLAARPGALDGWRAPTRTDALWAYRARLDARLAELEAELEAERTR